MVTVYNKNLINDPPLVTAKTFIAENFASTLENYDTVLARAINTAYILNDLNFENTVVLAAFLYNFSFFNEKLLEQIKINFGDGVTKLILDTKQIASIDDLQLNFHKQKIDALRKALLTMVRDVRAVVIKLADTLTALKFLKSTKDEAAQHNFAEKVLHIFAPLASRLGIYYLKWQLEDLAFSYLAPQEYKVIANSLIEKRSEREIRVNNIIEQLKKLLQKHNIAAEVYGRVKHIYSIKRKMQQKNLSFAKILDTMAVRIVTEDIPGCYQALSIAHENWQPVAEEFDDYIAAPKINGYQSIHTALKDENGKIFELQIRTHKMHTHAEGGIAAHWSYKENFSSEKNYEQKVNWLRTLLSWQKDLVSENNFDKEIEHKLFHERIYVFTPNGDVIDLPNGATPIDFAYHIHTNLGHKCRGAQVNGVLQPLTYKLKTCDNVNILINKNGAPSRDWLLQNSAYTATTFARNKISQWFRQQEFEHYYQTGKALVEKELKKLNLPMADLTAVAQKKNFKTTDMLFAAIGQNSITLASVINAVAPEEKIVNFLPLKNNKVKSEKIKNSIVKIAGVENILSRVAKCCHPIPGDKIIGYITKGNGISIHNIKCSYITDSSIKDRLIAVNWSAIKENSYLTKIIIHALDYQNLLKDITNILSNEKVKIIKLDTALTKKTNIVTLNFTIETANIAALDELFKKITTLPNVHSAQRV